MADKPVADGQAVLAGRIDAITPVETGGYFTRLILPAPDQFTSPAYVEVQSKQRLGQVGEDTRVTVQVRGARNDFQRKNGSEAKSARNYLHVIE